MSLLSLRGVTKRYGAVTAADAVDLDIPAGGRTAIVGPSGSGKTTLLRLIAGFETPDAGSIALGETVLAEGALAVPPHKRGIGYVAQEGALFPHLTLAGNIGFGMPAQAGRAARVEALMAAVGLSPDMAKRFPHEISGGQQQRVALARALARQPRLMLLDEPFSALDAGLREAMRDMVASVLAEAGVTAILVTHDQAEALSFAEHLAIMRNGVLVQAGPPRELYRRPTDPQTAAFLGEAIILHADLAGGFAACALGRVPVDGARTGKGLVLLRPEQVRLLPEGQGAPGRVLSCAFRGPTCRIVVSVDGGQAPIGISVSSLAGVAAGSAVGLGVEGRGHVFERED